MRNFCDSWRTKARAYCSDDLIGAFDRFFTSYVAFNRLYAEATYRLARRGEIKLKERFPDAQAAQDYVVQFCGAGILTSAWEDNPPSALDKIAEHLREGKFALKLDPMTGERRPNKDQALAAALESRSRTSAPRRLLKLSTQSAATCSTVRRASTLPSSNFSGRRSCCLRRLSRYFIADLMRAICLFVEMNFR